MKKLDISKKQLRFIEWGSFSLICLALTFLFVVHAESDLNELKNQHNILCEKDSGFTIYKKLERNKGWEVDNKFIGVLYAGMDEISFVRFQENGKSYDMEYRSGDKKNINSYDISESKNVDTVYRAQSYPSIELENGLILGLATYTEVETSQVVSEYRNYVSKKNEEHNLSCINSISIFFVSNFYKLFY